MICASNAKSIFPPLNTTATRFPLKSNFRASSAATPTAPEPSTINCWVSASARIAAGSGGGFNYGWRVMEGSLCYNLSSGCDTSGKVLPVAEYDTHAGGSCPVTGGYVYRGAQFPWIQGLYFYGDYCSGRLWALMQQ